MKDTTLHFNCPDKAMGICSFDPVLVSIIATSVNAGEKGYPGTDYGVANCSTLSTMMLPDVVTIKAGAIKSMFGASKDIKQVSTRVVRGGFPPLFQFDGKGNAVTLLVGRGVLGVAPK